MIVVIAEADEIAETARREYYAREEYPFVNLYPGKNTSTRPGKGWQELGAALGTIAFMAMMVFMVMLALCK